MFRAPLNRWLVAVLLVLAGGFAPPAGAAEPIAVYASASATGAVRELAARYEHERGVKVVTSFAAAPALAKQIEQGAPADMFLSAGAKWMDRLDGQGKIVPGSRRHGFTVLD